MTAVFPTVLLLLLAGEASAFLQQPQAGMLLSREPVRRRSTVAMKGAASSSQSRQAWQIFDFEKPRSRDAPQPAASSGAHAAPESKLPTNKAKANALQANKEQWGITEPLKASSSAGQSSKRPAQAAPESKLPTNKAKANALQANKEQWGITEPLKASSSAGQSSKRPAQAAPESKLPTNKAKANALQANKEQWGITEPLKASSSAGQSSKRPAQAAPESKLPTNKAKANALQANKEQWGITEPLKASSSAGQSSKRPAQAAPESKLPTNKAKANALQANKEQWGIMEPLKASSSAGQSSKLPAALTAICLAVFVQMLAEGIAISTIPLHLSSFGASPLQVGLATSAFSLSQMVACPLVVKLSTSEGRQKVLRACLVGTTIASLIIASSSSIYVIIAARFLAGIFAAAIPVAQAGATDIVPPEQSSLVLARVASVAQLGIVVGPLIAAICTYVLQLIGVPDVVQVRGVFAASGAFSLAVLALNQSLKAGAADDAGAQKEWAAAEKAAVVAFPDQLTGTVVLSRLTQPLLRLVALALGWSLTLSVSTYCLLGANMLGYSQPQLSLTFSAGAAMTIATQLVLFPRIVKKIGEHLACTAGLAAVAVGLTGMSTLVAQPYHQLFYLLNRAGGGVADTATAALVTLSSRGRDERAQNLALIQSTRAFARIFTPLISGSLFMRQATLPYYIVATMVAFFAPLPLFLSGRTNMKRIGSADASTRSAPSREQTTSAPVKTVSAVPAAPAATDKQPSTAAPAPAPAPAAPVSSTPAQEKPSIPSIRAYSQFDEAAVSTVFGEKLNQLQKTRQKNLSDKMAGGARVEYEPGLSLDDLVKKTNGDEQDYKAYLDQVQKKRMERLDKKMND